MKYVILALCFVCGAAQAEGFYIEGGLAAIDQPNAKKTMTYNYTGVVTGPNGEITSYQASTQAAGYHHYDINDVRNPYGALSIGYDWRWRAVVIDLQLQHQSSLEVNDHGQNSLRLNVRWYPFAR